MGNFLFHCNECLTRKEQNEASSLKDQIKALTETVNNLVKKNQIDELTDTVNSLVKDFRSFKESKKPSVGGKDNVSSGKIGDVNKRDSKKGTSYSDKVKNVKSSLCIQSNGSTVNIERVQELATNNGIQVSKAVVRDNGNVHVHLPSEENRAKLEPLLNDKAFASNKIVTLKSKTPSISILDVKKFTTDEEFLEKIKKQNPKIKQLMDTGSDFSIVYKRDPNNSNTGNKFYQVVARVSDEIRNAIRENNNKIYIELDAYRVVDRFYIKRCNRCQNFGHYEKDCMNDLCCAYCSQTHNHQNVTKLRRAIMNTMAVAIVKNMWNHRWAIQQCGTNVLLIYQCKRNYESLFHVTRQKTHKGISVFNKLQTFVMEYLVCFK